MDGQNRTAILLAGAAHPLCREIAAHLSGAGYAVTLRNAAGADATIASGPDCLIDASGLADPSPDRLARAAAAFAARLGDRGPGSFIALLDDASANAAFLDAGLAGLISAIRGLAWRLAPRVRVNAILAGARPEDAGEAVRLILDCPSMTGQTITLDADPNRLPTGRDGLLAHRPPDDGTDMVGAGLRRVFVRDLVLGGRIGVYRHERFGEQRVRINVDLAVRENEAAVGDRLADVVCYDRVVSGIRTVVAAGHVNLVETLAERIAAMCLSDDRVHVARVRVEKLDVYADAVSAGVEIERLKPNP